MMFDMSSAWVRRFLPLIPRGSLPVLDLACGEGRHLRLLIGNAYRATGVDKRMVGHADLLGDPSLEFIQRDLEDAQQDGSDWPFEGRQFAGVIVSNYLYRPILPKLPGLLAPGGILLYETFMTGHERFGQPSNPDYLLQPNELLAAFMDELEVVAFEQGEIGSPRQAMVQRIAARRPSPNDPGTSIPSP